MPWSVFATPSVTLAWNPNTNADVAGYKVYYGSVSHTYTNVISVGNSTSVTILGLVRGATYYFAATTISTSGLESAYSPEISYTVPNTISGMPPPPTIITRKVTADVTNLITLQFTTNLSSPNWQVIGSLIGSTTVSFTNRPAVFIRGVCANLTGSVTLTWQASTDSNVVGYKIYYGFASHTYTSVVDVGNVTKARISNLIQGVTYYFMITAYYSSGNVVQYSNEISARAQAPNFSLTIAPP